MNDFIEIKVRDSGRPALIDAALAELAVYRWRLSEKGQVFRYGSTVHHLRYDVLGARPPAGYMIAFRNSCKLDCRRENLYSIKIADYVRPYSAQRRNVTGLRGVTLRRDIGRYMASCTVKGKEYRLGYFDTPEEADNVVRNFRLAHSPIVQSLI